jgi:DNA-binding SARP family transcriptional activator
MRWVDLGLRYLGALIEKEAHDAGVVAALEQRLAQPPRFARANGSETLSEQQGPAGSPKEGKPSWSEQEDVVGAGGPRAEDLGPEGEMEAAAFERWWTGQERPESGGGAAHAPEPACERVPSLVMALVGACGLEVVLEPAPAGRLGWFVPAAPRDEGSGQAGRYVLAPDIGLEDLEALAAERWPAWPALVAVGECEGDTVLLNLEHAGVLSVEGPAARVSGLLCAVLVQLASQPWAEEMVAGLYAVGKSPVEGQLAGRVQQVGAPAAMDLAEKLDAVASARLELAGSSSLSTMRALACEALPNVAVAFPSTPADALRCMAEAAVPERSGVALVAAGPVEGAQWTLELGSGSSAVLRGRSGGNDVVVQMVTGFRSEEVALLSEALSRPDGEGFVELNEEAGGDADDRAVQARDDGVGARAGAPMEGAVEVVANGKGLSEGGRGTDGGGGCPAGAGAPPAVEDDNGRLTTRVTESEPAVQIRFLGPVDVLGGDMDALGSSRIMAALGLLSYLAAHERPVSADELASALWPLDATRDNFGGPQRKTVMNVVSRARSVLGYGINGKERIVLTPMGYRLAGDVGSDWDLFRKRVSTAHTLGGSPEAVAHLRAALELVRGEPFGGVMASQFFEWVASEHLDMVISARIVDVAEELGDLALGAGDLGLVYWAVERGLQIEPTREELFRLWMHALGREGRPARVDDVYRRLKLVLRQRIHPLQEPQPASREVWQRYVAMEGAAGR